MAILTIPDKGVTLHNADEIRAYLAQRGILYTQWTADAAFSPNATQEEILSAYASVLTPYMAEHGYQTADVISVHAETPNLPEIRVKFLQEHTHTEDEVRFFVNGQGFFWFNLEADEPVFCVKCVAGDLLSVPANFKHWFDLGPIPFVKTIRVFTDASGWTPHYTGSGVDARYREAAVGQSPIHQQSASQQHLPKMPRFILLDIEGTTTDINFVHQVLFPYSAERLDGYVAQHADSAEVQAVIQSVQETVQAEQHRLIQKPEAIETLLQWIQADRKHTALKQLQGLIWKDGFEKGEYQGHVYPDVPELLNHWKQQGLGLGIYSSGSVQAQQLLFQYSIYGDLTPYFSNYFDTQVGGKKESAAYRLIAKQLNLAPAEILFLSDVEAELQAASEAGLQTILLVREGSITPSKFPTVSNFKEIALPIAV